MAAIAWRKKQFRKYFILEENYNKFHQLAARLLESPTEKIMRLVQESIAVWLLSVDEKRASVWWRTYHMGELGNVSNASAGYVGTNMASGQEVCWRTIRRDTIGTAGSNMSMSVEVFAPSLVKCVKDMSEKHSDTLLNEKTGQYRFPSVPEIEPALPGKLEICAEIRCQAPPVGLDVAQQICTLAVGARN